MLPYDEFGIVIYLYTITYSATCNQSTNSDLVIQTVIDITVEEFNKWIQEMG